MNFRKCLWMLLILLFVLPVFASELDKKLDTLTKQIITDMTKNTTLLKKDQKITIAVVEFSDINGNNTLLGKSIAEQLTTKLYLTHKFELIERGLLDKVLAELKLDRTGLIDSVSAKELGKLLGANAIVTGTITELDKTIQLNARLIATETGRIFGAAAVEMKKDEDIVKLLNLKAPNPENLKGNHDTLPDSSNVTKNETDTANEPTSNSALSDEASETKSDTSDGFRSQNDSTNEGQTFVNPILTGIQNKKPDYLEDFHNPKSGWPIGKGTDPNDHGELGYENGEYYFSASPTGGIAAQSMPIPKCIDFVLELDLRFISGGKAGLSIQFRDWREKVGGLSSLELWKNNEIEFLVVNQNGVTNFFSAGDLPSFKWGSEWNHLQLIVKDAQVAAVLNGSLAAYIPKYPYPRDIINGDFRLWFTNQGASPARVQIDNFKVWDLSKVKIPTNQGISSPKPDANSKLKQVPSQYHTIQAAIDAAKKGDEVVVAPGTYEEIIDFKGKDITLRSVNPDDPKVVAATIIDAKKFKKQKLASDNGFTADSGFSAVVFRSGEGSAAVLEGFTITGGSGTLTPSAANSADLTLCGGGIYIAHGSGPTIQKNVITNNWGVFGGGIGIYDSSNPVIRENTIAKNRCEGAGGGIIAWYNCHPVIENNTFSGNLAGGRGGAIQIFDGSTAKIFGNVFKNNQAEHGDGGAIDAEYGSIFQADGTTPITDTDGVNTFIDNKGKEYPNIAM